MATNAIESAGRRQPAAAGKQASALVRRDYTLEQKLQVVKETLAPGASVSVVARQHDINSNIVFRWRKLFREGRLVPGLADKRLSVAGFVPIHVVADAAARPALPAPQSSSPAAAPRPRRKSSSRKRGAIEIELADGIVVRVDGPIDDRALRRVLAAIRSP